MGIPGESLLKYMLAKPYCPEPVWSGHITDQNSCQISDLNTHCGPETLIEFQNSMEISTAHRSVYKCNFTKLV